jgi:hypothetical protein
MHHTLWGGEEVNFHFVPLKKLYIPYILTNSKLNLYYMLKSHVSDALYIYENK